MVTQVTTTTPQTITPCLWCTGNAEQMVNFYVSIFKNSKILKTSYYGEGMPLPKGAVMTIQFSLDGQEFLALNGGPQFTHSPAISFVVNCDTQAEIDHYWHKLLQGGMANQCGWLQDQFGISWQIVPRIIGTLVGSDPAASARVMAAVMQMVKLDIAKLQQAFDQV